jgi:hypothetical protein
MDEELGRKKPFRVVGPLVKSRSGDKLRVSCARLAGFGESLLLRYHSLVGGAGISKCSAWCHYGTRGGFGTVWRSVREQVYSKRSFGEAVAGTLFWCLPSRQR